MTNELTKTLMDSLNSFVKSDTILLERMVSERAFCGAFIEIDFVKRKIGIKLFKAGEELDLHVDSIQF